MKQINLTDKEWESLINYLGNLEERLEAEGYFLKRLGYNNNCSNAIEKIYGAK